MLTVMVLSALWLVVWPWAAWKQFIAHMNAEWEALR